MSLADAVPSIVSAALALAVIVGMLKRHKVRACLLFPIYLSVTVLGHSAMVVFPNAFWNWKFWAVSDLVHTGLRVGIVFEIALKALRALPRGHQRARRVLFSIACATFCAVLLYPWQYGDAFELTQVFGWVTYGVALMFTVFLVVVVRYGVPLDPFHRAIASGFAVAGALLAFGHTVGHHSVLGRAALSKTAYACVLAFWTWAAWRKDDLSDMSPEAIARLWPWRRP